MNTTAMNAPGWNYLREKQKMTAILDCAFDHGFSNNAGSKSLQFFLEQFLAFTKGLQIARL